MKMILGTLLVACLSQTYSTSFDNPSDVWGKFEEPINACYTTNSGSVSIENASLKVVANQSGTLLSNHIIAQKRLNYTGVNGRITYRVNFFIDADVSDWLTYPHTGPEISVQNTRLVNGTYLTSTAGIQYVANPWNTHWNVWAETSPGVAGWVSFTGPVLTPRTWYKLTLKANMDTNTYTSAVLCQGGSCQSLPIGGLDIAGEAKWNEAALWLTAEAENLWQSQCGGPGALPLTGTVFYDDILFK